MNTKKEIAIAIVEVFEDLLEQHNVVIPDDDRPVDNDAPLYGITWDKMVASVMRSVDSGLEHLRDEQQCLLTDIINEREGLSELDAKGIALDGKYSEVTGNLSAIDTVMSLIALDFSDFHNLQYESNF